MAMVNDCGQIWWLGTTAHSAYHQAKAKWNLNNQLVKCRSLGDSTPCFAMTQDQRVASGAVWVVTSLNNYVWKANGPIDQCVWILFIAVRITPQETNGCCSLASDHSCNDHYLPCPSLANHRRLSCFHPHHRIKQLLRTTVSPKVHSCFCWLAVLTFYPQLNDFGCAVYPLGGSYYDGLRTTTSCSPSCETASKNLWWMIGTWSLPVWKWCVFPSILEKPGKHH